MRVYVSVILCAAANGGNIESYTSSGAQVYLDEKCILKGKTEGKMYIGARFTVQPSSAFCFLQEEIDFTTRSIACVDSCLNKLSCNGAIKKDILKKVNADSVFASERRLTFDPHHVRVEFCCKISLCMQTTHKAPNNPHACAYIYICMHACMCICTGLEPWFLFAACNWGSWGFRG